MGWLNSLGPSFCGSFTRTLFFLSRLLFLWWLLLKLNKKTSEQKRRRTSTDTKGPTEPVLPRGLVTRGHAYACSKIHLQITRLQAPFPPCGEFYFNGGWPHN